MEKLIWLFTLLFTLGCNPSKYTQVSQGINDCEEYYNFIEQNLAKVDSGWYEFVSLETIYKKYDEGKFAYPFLGECLIGKNKAFCVEYFGTPHRELIIPHDDYNVFIYCFDEICVQEKKCYSSLSSGGFIVYFDKSDRLINIMPFVDYRIGYRMLDRE